MFVSPLFNCLFFSTGSNDNNNANNIIISNTAITIKFIYLLIDMNNDAPLRGAMGFCRVGVFLEEVI